MMESMPTANSGTEVISQLKEKSEAKKNAAEQYRALQVKLQGIFETAKKEAKGAINALTGSAAEDDMLKHLLEEQGLPSIGNELIETLGAHSNIAEQDARSAEIEMEVRGELGAGASEGTVRDLTDQRRSKEFGWE
jgi:hypothetical protein